MISDVSTLTARLDSDHREISGEPHTPRAAVAAVFRGAEDDIELLFIQRATHSSDPWSGQMAFPGGRREDGDRSAMATAARETLEEVGLDLDAARYIGSLSDLDGGRANNRRIIVSAHAYWLDGPRPDLRPNYEVADVVWVPLSHLADRDRYIEYEYPLTETTFPGIRLDGRGQVIWGLTLRLLSDLFARLGHPFIIDYEG